HEVDPRELPLQVAAREGHPVADVALEVRRADGTVRNVTGSAASLFGKKGEWLAAIAAFVDTTDRKAVEDAMRAMDVAMAVHA
ncbi:hypothetical protein NL533_34165, partial [Klebsiella pneumoniae]|nr:hypothetical protein [Klebsiella pneumoniae]